MFTRLLTATIAILAIGAALMWLAPFIVIGVMILGLLKWVVGPALKDARDHGTDIIDIDLTGRPG